MHTVIFEGNDLDQFKSLVESALRGDLGTLRAVQLYVQDDGRIVLGTNGYTSQPIGRPTSDLSTSGHESRMGSAQPSVDMDAPSGNMNVDMGFGESKGSKNRRISKLEKQVGALTKFASDVAREYGLDASDIFEVTMINGKPYSDYATP